ncbi:hypothetical protein [uncultured Roseobacter sp.]|uniref:hypothetical protein n=1 Tax=uncultured Roseobacter sp. TaxID=114847 RepID=UPI002636B9EB|nr:hypothetical protein [uncultured Roseobacter sp.]
MILLFHPFGGWRGYFMLIRLAAIKSIFALLAFAIPATAQPAIETQMSLLDMTEIDGIIEDISQQVELLQFGASANGLAPATSVERDDETQVAAIQSGTRLRLNPLCFLDSEYGHNTPAELDAYFNDLEDIVGKVSATMVSFTGLKEQYDQGSCPGFMQGMLEESQSQLNVVSRPQLSDMVYHLETCWPDDGVAEADGSPLDIDARYARARQSLSSFRISMRSYREAAQWCE